MFSGKGKIKAKALCMFQQNDFIFVSKLFDSIKQDSYYRPIGGTIEFGEYSKDTLIREILEELGTEIRNVRLDKILENIFVCDGIEGHEIVFLYRADFKDRQFYEMKEYKLVESNGEVVPAFWISKNDFINGKLRLVPEKLNEILR
jgi:8-oxo-dGTP pyrophosphatase MutT (NUDIX family)